MYYRGRGRGGVCLGDSHIAQTQVHMHAHTGSRPLPHPHSTAVAQTLHGIIDDLIEDFEEFSAHFVHL